MNQNTINGVGYAQMLLGGAARLSEHAEEVNGLNVFPVPDGDTGTNMTKTIEGGLAEIGDENTDENIGEVSARFARGILLGARGNSGVILSQIFAGINQGLSGHDTVNARELSEAYKIGIEKSYAAVQNPTEGTILTVFRESAEYAAAAIDENSTVEDFLRLHIEEARRSLAATKEILPALAEADVIDSGGAGYLYIAEGMYEVLTGKKTHESYHPTAEIRSAVDISMFTRDSVLEHGYCTEFLLRLTTAKCDPDSFDISCLISALEEMGGESIVAYMQEDIVKVHVHTFAPGDVLSRAQTYGEFLTVKIENMSLGHSGEQKPAKKKKKKKFSVVAVATGDGISALFTDLGADYIIGGGQTANPSIEEFVEAFEACESENIIVLPNNKNIILAAKQAAEIYEGAEIYVVETKSIMQGYSALSVITPGITDMDTLVSSATRAAHSVNDCEITMAVRDATIDGRVIKTGDYIAISHGEITAVADSAVNATKEALAAADADLAEIITVFVGENVSEEERASFTEELEELYPDCEIVVYEGGQHVYHYMVGIE